MKHALKKADLDQLELPLSKRAKPVPIPDSVIAAQPSKIAAIKLCISSSGLDDKEIAGVLEIDSGHWSRMMSNAAYFPNNKEQALMDLCGNDIPLRWDAFRRGYELKPLRSELERENEELRTLLAQKEREHELIVDFMRKVKT
jgi:hypothetical protein